MLLNKPYFYYRHIKEEFANSYIAEDVNQVIIGIDYESFDANKISYEELKQNFNEKCNSQLCSFDGFFGVFSYDSICFYEDVGEAPQKSFEFPYFFFASARAYLHYNKINKIYTFYGDKQKYYEKLLHAQTKQEQTNELVYQVKTCLKKEKKHFYKIFKQAKEYIKSGDVFQIVLSEQLKIKSNLDSLDFLDLLKKANPSPYMYHFSTPYGDVVGASPEIVVEIKKSQILIAPIAGTRGRGKDANEDMELKNDLLSDKKELSEHMMLVDLARNDIGKFAKKGSVEVKNLLNVVQYEHVMHIVSEVYAQKKEDISIFDIISIVFPAGTLSGTPKIRAMQLINELEKKRRNVYGGAIGFLHFSQDVQLAIVIRSAFFEYSKKNMKNVFIQAGAGLVSDSNKKNEYQEICKKRASVLNIFANNCKNIK